MHASTAKQYFYESAHPHAVTRIVNGTTTQQFVYNENGEMISRGRDSISWDGAGNMSAIGDHDFGYDFNNARLFKLSNSGEILYPFSDVKVEIGVYFPYI